MVVTPTARLRLRALRFGLRLRCPPRRRMRRPSTAGVAEREAIGIHLAKPGIEGAFDRGRRLRSREQTLQNFLLLCKAQFFIAQLIEIDDQAAEVAVVQILRGLFSGHRSVNSSDG